ncbi:MAG TPA: hypothetical protein VML50_15060 [Anaeromyxobacter sp.]|nr:hypothetical protein [Anaeromyxobacter sp.]
MRRGALALSAALACAPALRPPPPPSATPAAPAGDAPALLAEARAEWARRPDPAAVSRAEARFLSAAQADPKGVEALLGAIEARVWRAGHERTGSDRAAAARAAVEAGQLCEQRAPGSPVCAFGLALALGVQAREVPTTARDGIKRMVPLLQRAAEADPGLEEGGPLRVLALVLVRAPGWPLGPGDPEAALAAARKAAALFPDHPANQLALAEARLATGDEAGGRAAAARGLALARARAEQGDPDAPEQVKDAEKLLSRPPPPKDPAGPG